MLAFIFPILKIVGGIFGSFFSEETAVVRAQATVETASIESAAAVEQRWWFVAAMIPVLALPYAVWEWKAIVWDKVIMNGHTATDPLTGALAWGFPIVLCGLFLHALKSN